MLRKGAISLHEVMVDTNEEYEAYMESHNDNLILMEVYAGYCGYCVPLSSTIRKCKMELGREKLDLVKACSDKIDHLEMFKYKSEPTFLFVRNRKMKRVMFGANSMELLRICTEMLDLVRKEKEVEDMGEDYNEIMDIVPEETICV